MRWASVLDTGLISGRNVGNQSISVGQWQGVPTRRQVVGCKWEEDFLLLWILADFFIYPVSLTQISYSYSNLIFKDIFNFKNYLPLSFQAIRVFHKFQFFEARSYIFCISSGTKKQHKNLIYQILWSDLKFGECRYHTIKSNIQGMKKYMKLVSGDNDKDLHEFLLVHTLLLDHGLML